MHKTDMLRERRIEHEWMDDPNIEPELHHHALNALARLNRVSRSDAILWGPIVAYSKSVGDRPVRILDIATGAGDIPIQLWKRAQKSGIGIHIEACDRSPQAIQFAEAKRRRVGAGITFYTADIIADGISEEYDIITNSLFMHHIDLSLSARLLSNLREKASMIIVSDLERSPLGMLLARFACNVFSRSPVVQYDGPRSVAAAYTIPEFQRLASSVGMEGAQFTRHWPMRFRMVWRKSINGHDPNS